MSKVTKRSGNTVPGYTPELGDRINRVVMKLGTQKAAADLLGVRPETVAAWRKGEQKPSLYDMIALCQAAGESITWLATGRDERDSLPNASHIVPRTQQERVDNLMIQVGSEVFEDGALVLIPRLQVEASAGAGMVVEEEDIAEMVAFDPRWLRSRSITPNAAKVVTARGDSMEPTIRSGDLLVVDTAIDTAVDSGVYVVGYGGALLVKRLFMLRTGGIVLSSDNKIAGRDEEVAPHELDQLRIAGRVMWYGRMM